MRRLVYWSLIIIVFAGVVSAVAYPTMTWWKDHNAPKYLTATVSRGRVETVVNSTGTVKPVRTVSVGAFTSGPIKKVEVDFNDWIEEPEKLLAIIDDKLQKSAVDRDKAAVDTQKADLKRIEALLEQAKRNDQRAKLLRDVNVEYISDTELDQFKYTALTLVAQCDLAQASIRQAEANLQNAKEQLDYTKIRGPKEIKAQKKGIVIDRKVDPGQTVAASFQTPELFTIALEMDVHVYVYASVDEADIGMIRNTKDRGQTVKFTVDAYPGELFEGKIKEIRLNSTTTQNVVTYPVVIDAPNFLQGPKKELKLKPGMTTNITFPIDGKDNVLRVPVAALRFTPLAAQVHPEDRHYLEAITAGQNVTGVKRTASEKAGMAQGRQRRIVWVQEGQLLRGVPVTLGLVEHRYAEVLQGELHEGQTVVTGTEGALTPR